MQVPGVRANRGQAVEEDAQFPQRDLPAPELPQDVPPVAAF